MTKHKVAIIGANDTYRQAPFDDPTWEIWGCNSLWKFCRDSQGMFRADRWFELHPLSVQTPAELDAIRACPVPIYLLGDEHTYSPNGRPYPLDQVLRELPYRYFTCTFAYQIALALYEGFTTIGLYGVELFQGTARERTVEKACVDFWTGVALGRDVTVSSPRPQASQHLYGYDYHAEGDAVNSIVDEIFTTRLDELERAGRIQQVFVGGHEGTA